ncbi:DUF6650 family protein [Comamonas sp. E6]|uniref:DUF6650 family protein n=1 Tax=Comamonas sp. E6 TaxID=364029 RepID=UPI0006319BC9|nr:DUF6650 family protein [Comamonas sp. E6]GAO72645.1 hypothetical protein CSE6_025_40820 [Comamonas sp. E6]
MNFKEILARVTGVSVPIFGIQWQPVTAEVTVARDVLRTLEDKRVLYNPYEMEGAHHCIRSVDDMRNTLTGALQKVNPQTHVGKQFARIRKACREFCNIVGSPEFDRAAIPIQKSLLSRELTKLRKTAGSAVAAIVIAYGLDVEDDLASIIPFNNAP